MNTYTVALIFIILGLLSLVFKHYFSDVSPAILYFDDLAGVFLVSGLLSFLFKTFVDKENEQNLRRLFRIHDSVDELGLVEVMPGSQGYDFTEMIEKSTNLSVVINDGKHWIGNNTVALRDRFSKAGITEIFTVDPESSFVSTLADKVSLKEDELKKKIHDSWKLLKDTYNESERIGTFRIYRLGTYPTRTIYMTEETLIETPYQVASGRVNIPLYIFRNVPRDDSLYAFAKRDLEFIREEAKLVEEFKGNPFKENT